MATVDAALEDTRRRTNPLFNDNKMKLGIFSLNVDHGSAMTTAEGSWVPDWAECRKLAQLADNAGFEALVPVARWRGFGGATNFNGQSLETYTWAAGLAEATRHIAIFSTSHVPTVHPILAAKQATTIDHISGGRFALNIVSGWFAPEFEMFGAPIMEHETRYAYAQEWIDVVKLLWTSEEEFEFDGRFFHIRKGFHQPKPLQGVPALMNAGGSPTGQRFAARNVDMAFVELLSHNYEGVKEQVDTFRNMAQDEFNRTLGFWANTYVVCRPTEKEATQYLKYFVEEKGDDVGVENLMAVLGMQSGSIPKELFEQFKFHLKAGYGGYPLVGTPEQITDKLLQLSKAGIGGVLMSWVNYQEEVPAFIESVVPLMEQAGLRQPARAAT